MKAYRGMESYFHSFLTLALDGDDWSTSCPWQLFSSLSFSSSSCSSLAQQPNAGQGHLIQATVPIEQEASAATAGLDFRRGNRRRYEHLNGLSTYMPIGLRRGSTADRLLGLRV